MRETSKPIRRLISLLSASALVAAMAVASVPAVASAAAPPAPYFNGFEDAGDAVTPSTSATEPMFNVTRVASGTGGITSAAGAYHAVAAASSGAFTRLGGYSPVFPAGGFVTTIDVYLDMSVATGANDLRFDWSSAVSDTSGNHRRDFVFSVGTNPTVAGEFLLSASNTTPGWPGNPGRDPITVAQSGWYTFQHTFRDDGGVLSVDMEILDAGGTSLHMWNLSDPTDIIGSTVGGNRYGWLVNNAFPLALDNVIRSGEVEPATIRLLKNTVPADGSLWNFVITNGNDQTYQSYTDQATPFDSGVLSIPNPTAIEIDEWAGTGTDIADYNASVACTDDGAPLVPTASDYYDVGSQTRFYVYFIPAQPGHDYVCTFTNTNPFEFDGFYAPIDNQPSVNVVKAGQAIPIKFSLGGDEGLDIFAAGYPKSVNVACETGATLDLVEETVNAGGSSLSYDPLTDTYAYVWKTSKSWSGTCRQLEVKLTDGSSYFASFQFKK